MVGGEKEEPAKHKRTLLYDWQTIESDHITPEEGAAGFRLGCLATAREDLLIYIPEESRTGKQVVSKAARPIPIDHDPAVKTYFLHVPEASLTDPSGDFERLGQAL
jgi:uncharacterized 2Fe-2S/4Fe-4S cluster protein (DUF4445 family)